MITISQINFPTHGLGLAGSRQALNMAVRSFNQVCGIDMRIVPSGGTIWFEPLGNDSVAGQTQDNLIRISTVRRFGLVEVLAGIIMHEIGHTKAGPNWKHWENTVKNQDRLMHPWGSSTLWFHPREVQLLQEEFGGPTVEFTVPFVQRAAKAANIYYHSFVVSNPTPGHREIHADLVAERNRMALMWTGIPFASSAYRQWTGMKATLQPDIEHPDVNCECCAQTVEIFRADVTYVTVTESGSKAVTLPWTVKHGGPS